MTDGFRGMAREAAGAAVVTGCGRRQRWRRLAGGGGWRLGVTAAEQGAEVGGGAGEIE